MTTSAVPPFFLIRLQSLLGIIPIGVFFAEHAFSNSLAFFYGAERFNEQVEFLQGLPFVYFLEIFGIGLPILLHAGIGIYIWLRGLSNVQNYSYFRNWLYSLQRWSGVIAIIFIVYHVYKLRIEWMFTTDLTHVNAEYVKEYFNETWHILFYFVGVLAASFHFGNGLWNFLIKWGVTIGDRAQRVSGVICTIIGIITFLFFMSSLYAFSV